MKLPLRKLGETGLEVSSLGLGTVKIGRNQGVKYPNQFELPTDGEVRDLLAMSKELGFNLLDTAPAYGSSEERLGQLMENRSDWILCSKAGEDFIDGESSYQFSGQHLRSSVERSLRNLATDYLDILLIHSNGDDQYILNSTDCVAELEKLRDQGLVRAIGMSSKTVEGGIQAAQSLDVVMATYNIQFREEEAVLAECRKLGKGTLVKKALASGHIAKAGDCSASQSLEFVLANDAVSSVIVGTINPHHLRENASIACAVG